MHPIDRRVLENLKTLAERGRAAAEERDLRFAEAHPMLPCAGCAGQGCYAEREGVRRPFDHRDFKPENGDRFVATCPDCRGLGRVPTSLVEVEALASERRAAARVAYEQLRTEVCRARGLTPSAFDRIARKQFATATPSPEDWVAAAQAIRSIYL